MPAVIVGKRLGRRPFALGRRLNRWFWRNRPQIAMIVTFVVACVLGLIAADLGRHDLTGKP
ncbi:hypothetical protein DJ021_00955 [Phenylobacterium hankyongense]|uniref:Uncharacterized protein n=1 Tax=Phenylobacterium hankyongense TaxID=1813876 RepID=A0A328AW40_9CAUL|nr:hypothetical protein [Phenylobacterium hankyongense]RAK58465.1 hypothetical protein DJ021_00955 [Phenylobacterium hankyongense]